MDHAAPPASATGFWRIAEAQPELTAILDDDGTSTTFGALLDSSRSIAAGFRRLGLRAGDHVAMLLPNHASFFEVLLATSETGLFLTPISSHLVADEVAHVLADSDAKAFVAHDVLAPIAADAVGGAGFDQSRCFAVGAIEGFRPITSLRVDRPGPPPGRTPGATMMYTSGTTGKPKGVKRSRPDGDPDDVFGHAALVTARGFGVPPRPHAHLVCGPLYHAGPFVGAWNVLHLGGCLVLMDRWTPERCLELIDTHRVESTQMVPTMFHRLLNLPDDVRHRHDVRSLTSVFHTGAPCPPEVKQRIMDWWGPVVYETYGGTEGVATIATPRRWLQKPGTVGRAVIGTTLHILDEDGTELPSGDVGEVWIESSSGPSEYYKDPEKTARARRGNWFTLGDIGFVDEEGYLFLRDRKIDLVIAGGVNVYPAEVEAALLQDPAVADAAVIGVPDAEWGEQVKAIVELRGGYPPSPTTEAMILASAAQRIAGFKCPRSIDFVTKMPRLPNGKIEKRRLREPYWADQQRAI